MHRVWLVAVAGALAISPAHAQQRALPLDTLRSGIEFAGADVRSMQADDVANPGFLWIERGEKLWREGGKSCNVCHGDAPTSMRGVAARYPAYDAISRRASMIAAFAARDSPRSRANRTSFSRSALM